jgi:hypothetical protein
MMLQIEWVDRGQYNVLQMGRPTRQSIEQLAIQYVEPMASKYERAGLRSSLRAAKIGNEVYDVSEYPDDDLTNLFNVMSKADTIPRFVVQIM